MSTIRPKILVITGYGINCEEETAKCFNWAGGDAEIVHINDLIGTQSTSHSSPQPVKPQSISAPNILSSSLAKKLSNYQIVAFPGGFSYGDDTGSGNAMANKIRNNLKEDLLTFLKGDKLIIGICNGMQIMANLGLIPATDMKYGERQAALMRNLHVSLECRWIHVKNISKKCVWTRDIDLMHLPIAHGEGNFYVEPDTLEKMKAQDQIVFKFVNEDGSPANQKFPANPNGALEDITGVCDPTGRIFAMMPHPERFNSWTNEEGWELKKEKLIREHLAKTHSQSPNSPASITKPLNPFTDLHFPQEGAGLKIFRNGVNYFT